MPFGVGVLDKADKAWNEIHPREWFSSTYHAQVPSQWSLHVLSHALIKVQSKHLLHALTLLRNHSHGADPNASTLPAVQAFQGTLMHPRTDHSLQLAPFISRSGLSSPHQFGT